jgi:hypothetical protein
MKMYGEVRVKLHMFLTLALDEAEWSASHSGHFTPKTRTPASIG